MEVYSKSVHEAPECRKSPQSTLRPRSECRERFGIAHPNRCGSAVESLLCFPLMYVRLLVLALVTVAIVFILLPFSLLLLGLLPSTSLSLDLLGFLHLLLGQTWVIQRIQLQQAQYLEQEQLKTL